MEQRLPFVREAGAGAGVVCLHSNASTSNQWRELMERLAPKFHVLAPDSYEPTLFALIDADDGEAVKLFRRRIEPGCKAKKRRMA